MNHQKGFANIAIIVLVVVVLAGIAGYFTLVKKSPQIVQQTTTPTPTQTQSPKSLTPTSSIKTKSINLAGKYTVSVPVDFTVTEVSKAITKVPVYALGSPDGHNISISIHSYTSAESQIPGDCVVSKNFDVGTLSAPIFCEGLNLVDSFTISGNRYVKYGTVVSDTSLDCTMNSPCPVKVSAEVRYSKEYVFVVPDKSHNTIIEFFAGDAARGPSNSIKGFEGVSVTLHDVIIPSLAILIPKPTPTSIPTTFSKCLLADIKLSDVVDANITGYANGQPVGLHKVTVEQKLNELKATCNSDNKLVDVSGKQITFYHITGCWGNPPYNYQDILQKQRDEINKLKEQYTVIEMTCNPSGIPIQ